MYWLRGHEEEISTKVNRRVSVENSKVTDVAFLPLRPIAHSRNISPVLKLTRRAATELYFYWDQCVWVKKNALGIGWAGIT